MLLQAPFQPDIAIVTAACLKMHKEFGQVALEDLDEKEMILQKELRLRLLASRLKTCSQP